MIWDNIYIMNVLAGSIFILTGLITTYFPPKNINHLYGYRTKRSMKNKDQWDFAQRYSSKLTIYLGLILALTSFLGYLIDLSKINELVFGFITLISLIVTLLYYTEKALKNNF